MEEFVRSYGYFAVFFGSFIEGESIILTAGVMAYKGYLNLFYIIILAFLGTLLADQALFHIGKFYGPSLVQKNSFLQKKSARVFELLKKYDVGFILSFRFIYGIRIVSPILIGTSGVSTKKYTLLNIPAAAIWSILSCCAGYLLGEPILAFFEKIACFKTPIILCFLLIILGIFFSFYFFKRKTNL